MISIYDDDDNNNNNNNNATTTTNKFIIPQARDNGTHHATLWVLLCWLVFVTFSFLRSITDSYFDERKDTLSGTSLAERLMVYPFPPVS